MRYFITLECGKALECDKTFYFTRWRATIILFTICLGTYSKLKLAQISTFAKYLTDWYPPFKNIRHFSILLETVSGGKNRSSVLYSLIYTLKLNWKFHFKLRTDDCGAASACSTFLAVSRRNRIVGTRLGRVVLSTYSLSQLEHQCLWKKACKIPIFSPNVILRDLRYANKKGNSALKIFAPSWRSYKCR